MSNLAQEEADRFFNYEPSATSHPEDVDPSDTDSRKADDDNELSTRRGIKSRTKAEPEDPDTYDYEDDDADYDRTTAQRMSTTANTKTSYTVPSTRQYANTGPKGVIADAQNYHRAEHAESRTNRITQPSTTTTTTRTTQHTTNGNDPSDSSEEELNDLLEEEDSEFMRSWREKRLAEMQSQFTLDPSTSASSHHQQQQRKTWGTLEQVNAAGYLSAIEDPTTLTTTNILVFIFDRLNADRLEVEDELKMLAYKWNKTRFVKLHHKVAEMQSIEVPAILVYRGGEVVVTLSGARSDGLEELLGGQGVLVK